MRQRTVSRILSALLLLCILALLALKHASLTRKGFIKQWLQSYPEQSSAIDYSPEPFFLQLSDAAIERTRHSIRYVPDYVKINYPMGDVPADTGVCTDVIIRAYRELGIDLQVKVHEDMKKHFLEYPEMWGLIKPDPNIDHRRVPNLMTFFKRNGNTLPVTRNPGIYLPGDIVAWNLGSGITHIGIVVNKKNMRQYEIVHNIGFGPKMEDVLLDWEIIGHFRYPRRSNIGND